MEEEKLAKPSSDRGSAVMYRFDRFQADEDGFRLVAGGVQVALEPKALRVLLYLIQNRGRLVRKQELLDAVWGEAAVTESALTRSIGLLRKTLEDDSRDPRFIETVPTAGYRFIAEVEVAQELWAWPRQSPQVGTPLPPLPQQ
jgi:DNA-binding winged helix-turn-helix (wHTH) protein